ncbi:type II toxin-antitoxin system VapC family toxin [Candidatus Woesebacteria bacterium]|nr:type II toxin-antitoxin system VapC family toxin [Candidatus Woesebacteria bacterium]
MGVNTVLLDTNSYSRLTLGDRHIFNFLKRVETIYFSVIVLGELYSGFRQGSQKNRNITELEAFLRGNNIRLVKISEKSAEIYGKISYELRSFGTPIPTNDIWIAANSIETNSTLITYDKHFLEIKGLRVWDKI